MALVKKSLAMAISTLDTFPRELMMERASILGPMAQHIKVTMRRERNMVKENGKLKILLKDRKDIVCLQEDSMTIINAVSAP